MQCKVPKYLGILIVCSHVIPFPAALQAAVYLHQSRGFNQIDYCNMYSPHGEVCVAITNFCPYPPPPNPLLTPNPLPESSSSPVQLFCSKLGVCNCR